MLAVMYRGAWSQPLIYLSFGFLPCKGDCNLVIREHLLSMHEAIDCPGIQNKGLWKRGRMPS